MQLPMHCLIGLLISIAKSSGPISLSVSAGCTHYLTNFIAQLSPNFLDGMDCLLQYPGELQPLSQAPPPFPLHPPPPLNPVSTPKETQHDKGQSPPPWVGGYLTICQHYVEGMTPLLLLFCRNLLSGREKGRERFTSSPTSRGGGGHCQLKVPNFGLAIVPF